VIDFFFVLVPGGLGARFFACLNILTPVSDVVVRAQKAPRAMEVPS